MRPLIPFFALVLWTACITVEKSEPKITEPREVIYSPNIKWGEDGLFVCIYGSTQQKMLCMTAEEFQKTFAPPMPPAETL